MISLLAFAVLGVLAQGPTAWSTTVDVFYEAGAAGAYNPSVINIPYLVDSNLTVTLLTPNLNYTFQLCLKQNVAMPPVGYNNWAHNCALYTFQAPNGDDKRALVSSSSALHGSGSSARLDAVAAAAAVVRRALFADASGTAIVRAGEFFATVAGSAAPASNLSISLQLSGQTCASGYGPTCAAATPLDVNVTLPITLPPSGSQLFALNGAAFSASTGAFTLNVAAATPHATIWFRWASPPLATAYDAVFSNVGAGSYVQANPRAGEWFVLIANDNATSWSANLTITVTECTGGSFGASCNIQPVAAGNPGNVTSYPNLNTASVTTTFTFPAGVPITLAAAPNDPTQSPPTLIAKLGGVPSASDYDYINCNVASCSGQATILATLAYEAINLRNSTWYATVSGVTGGVSVWNAAACAGDCSGNGQCQASIAACSCTADFSGFDCSTSTSALERWEWALIIGGGVLVAIGLIGCIVYFIQKQQRRKGFERV